MNKNELILFLCRTIGPHQEKIINEMSKVYQNITVLCSSKGVKKEFKTFLHPYFTKIADHTFTNWTVIIIAPLLVFIDSLLYKRTKVIGHYTVTFGWAVVFNFVAKRVIFSMGSDLLLDPFKSFLRRITVIVALKHAHLMLFDNIEGYKIARDLGFKGKAVFSPYGAYLPTKIEGIAKRIKANGEIILWVRGAHKPVYNIECFLDALAVLNQRNLKNKWTVIIAGRGTKKKKVLDFIQNNNLNSRIKNMGYIRDKNIITKLYNKSSIFVSTAYSDGTSVSLLEAMVYGLTIIVSDFVNNSYWIKNNINGFLFDPNDPHKLADILQRIIDEDILIEKRLEFSKLSYDIVKLKGTVDNFNKKMQKLLKL